MELAPCSVQAKWIRSESFRALLLFLFLDFNFLFTFLGNQFKRSSHILLDILCSQCLCPQSELRVLHAFIFVAHCEP